MGRVADASGAYATALIHDPRSATALNGQGLLLQAAGAWEEAAQHFQRSVALKPTGDPGAVASLYANAGLALLERGFPLEGYQALLEAVSKIPEAPEPWRWLAGSLRHTKVAPTSLEFRQVLITLLQRDDVDPGDLSTAAVAVLKSDPKIAEALRVTRAQLVEGRTVRLDVSTLQSLAADPVLLPLLTSAPVPDVEVELLLTEVRRQLLDGHSGQDAGLAGDLGLEFVCALARQCYLNEYIYYESEAETVAVGNLEASLSGAEMSAGAPWMPIALLACFRPLHQTGARRWTGVQAPAPLAEVFRQQIEEPLEEAEIALTLGSLDSDVAAAAAPEAAADGPYPRWTRAAVGSPLPFRKALHARLPHLTVHQIPPVKHPRLLVVDSRAGLQVQAATRQYLNATVVVVDESRAKLAYAVRKLRAGHGKDVKYLHGLISDLAALPSDFDLVQAPTAMHTCQDPKVTMEQLARRLKPGGFLSVGLYSDTAREGVKQAHALLRDPILASGALTDIRSIRRELMLAEPGGVFDVLTSPASDFWSTSLCREMIFQLDEHRFNLLQVAELMAAARLEFLGLELSHPMDRQRFRTEHPEPDAQSDAHAWDAFEAAHPETFGASYRVWARKKRS